MSPPVLRGWDRLPGAASVDDVFTSIASIGCRLHSRLIWSKVKYLQPESAVVPTTSATATSGHTTLSGKTALQLCLHEHGTACTSARKVHTHRHNELDKLQHLSPARLLGYSCVDCRCTAALESKGGYTRHSSCSSTLAKRRYDISDHASCLS